MINRKLTSSKTFSIYKYIFVLLLLSYILGICIGSFFVFSNKVNAEFTHRIISNYDFKVLLYFITALLLKYSGVLSGLLAALPLFLGIQNSAGYSCKIMNPFTIKYEAALTAIKDTAVIMLLIFYIIIIINQIINKRYQLKKDLKHFCVYFSGALIVILLHILIRTIIF